MTEQLNVRDKLKALVDDTRNGFLNFDQLLEELTLVVEDAQDSAWVRGQQSTLPD